MNEAHSDSWMSYLAAAVVPWTLERVSLSGDLLEIGPGPGAATEVLRGRVRSLTAVEYDPCWPAAAPSALPTIRWFRHRRPG